MPRANRHFLAGCIWHITHRCHRRNFLLKFGRDRRSYLGWVLEAKKRFGLAVLNYIVTSNHIHLLVKDTGPNVIADSVQLMPAARSRIQSAQKRSHGAFWKTDIMPLRLRLTSICGVAYMVEATLTPSSGLRENTRTGERYPTHRSHRLGTFDPRQRLAVLYFRSPTEDRFPRSLRAS